MVIIKPNIRCHFLSFLSSLFDITFSPKEVGGVFCWFFFTLLLLSLKIPVICSSKIGYVFGGRSTHFGTEKWKRITLAFVPFQVIYFTQQVSHIGLGVYFAQWAKIGWLKKVLRSASLTLIQKQQLSNRQSLSLW